ncbi:hypothetical protein LJB77_02040 [Ruminococcaceae bacterium OttesenSCG-928-N02]|nr:hypothetical protein [Ruminococcaceae bacterium OttesenSCG-928-N02]
MRGKANLFQNFFERLRAPENRQMNFAVAAGALAMVAMVVCGCFYSVVAFAGSTDLTQLNASLGSSSVSKPASSSSEEQGDIPVTLYASSVEADLEVQIQGPDGEVLTGVMFELVVTYPNGNTKTWPIDDLEGFLHLTRLTEGDYTVEILPMEGYIMPQEPTVCKVKPKVVYKPIDVDDLIVDETEINVAEEDTIYTPSPPPATGPLVDTVEYVASSSTQKTVQETVQVKTYTPKVQVQGGVSYLLYASGTVSDIIVEQQGESYIAYRWVTPSTSTPPETSGSTSTPPSSGDESSGSSTPPASSSEEQQPQRVDVALYNADGTPLAEYAYDEHVSEQTVDKVVTVYTGWQTIGGKTYYYDKNGTYVTGWQVIQGVNYFFNDNGVRGGEIGIDVSKYQLTIDWQAVRASGITFVFIRCGYRGYGSGALVEDPYFRRNIQGATAAGLKVGVYFFSQAITTAEAVEEASMCLSLVRGYNLAYPIAFDTEHSGGNPGRADSLSVGQRTQIAIAFCETVRAGGYTPCVYSGKYWLMYNLDASQLSSYKIWLAHYTAQTDYKGRYDIWQYTSTGKVNGISGAVDMNISYMGY